MVWLVVGGCTVTADGGAARAYATDGFRFDRPELEAVALAVGIITTWALIRYGSLHRSPP